MLHVHLCGRQVRGRLAAALLGALLALTPTADTLASRADDLTSADALARSGQHAEAAELYESAAKRLFRGWDARIALLAAREYLAAGRLDDAVRMLERAGDAREQDDPVLFARVSAEVALARGRPELALEALRAAPTPWPAPVAAELLTLQARAEFSLGRLLDGLRSTEALVRVLGDAGERRDAYARLVEALAARPDAAIPARATPQERAWFEVGQLVAAAPGSDPMTQARLTAEWRARNPQHPGAAFLPQAGPPATAGRSPATARPLDLSSPAQAIALLLPLSGRLAAAGLAVRDGFLAAALAESPERRPRIEIHDTAAAGAAEAYRQALAAGAQAVAGPLLKEDVAALVAAGPLAIPTVALNSVPGDLPPAFLFQYSLDPEQEARDAARRVMQEGYQRGIVLVPNNSWGERVQAAFLDELQAGTVQVTAVQAYDPAAKDFSGPLRAALGRYGGAGDRDAQGELRKRDAAAEALNGPQFAFIAATSQVARALLPQLRFQMAYELPVFATSDAWDAGPRSVPDLDGLRVPEMPWILNGGMGAPALWDALQLEWLAPGRGRLHLYAFGFDAYQLVRGLNVAARGVTIDGLTGRLRIAQDGRVQRETEWAQVRDGRLEPASMPFLPETPLEP